MSLILSDQRNANMLITGINALRFSAKVTAGQHLYVLLCKELLGKLFIINGGFGPIIKTG